MSEIMLTWLVTTTWGLKDHRTAFTKHFNKENISHIKKVITGAKRLNRKIIAKEVKIAVWKMANNKAPGNYNINVELIKYAPKEVYRGIANILNGIYERNYTRIKLGTGILLPLPKPKKTQGPVKNLRPITLLEVIQKILSKSSWIGQNTRSTNICPNHRVHTENPEAPPMYSMGWQVDGC